MKALILAAGYATRLYPLTKDRPKPLLKIGDKTIVDYLLARFVEMDVIDDVFIVTNEKFYPNFREWAERTGKSGRYPNLNVHIVNDCTSSNETRLGAIADIQFVLDHHHFHDDLLIAAGDNIFQFDFVNFLKFFREKESDIILAHPIDSEERLRSAGVVEVDDDGRVIGFEEKPENPRSPLIAPALYIFKREHLHLFRGYLNLENPSDAPGSFIAWLHKIIPVYAFVMPEHYYDIGTYEMYNQVCAEFGQDANK
ncbi:MAG: nucleotidyltransferase family protein [Calditrichaeota bacterium]|nr:nucleotidyltransferase family protein [Calditrichota bacterium]